MHVNAHPLSTAEPAWSSQERATFEALWPGSLDRPSVLRMSHLAILALLLLGVGCRGAQPTAPPILLLISFDGWRADYSQRVATPNLDALAARGVRADSLTPVFPAQTFPNHYTIVTGLYPEHHGIVANTMDDPAIGERFTLSSATARDPRWWSGEPLWTTVAKQGGRAASMFWPGSEVAIGGVQPTYWFPYDGTRPNDERVDQVLEWFAQPEAMRPSFMTLYFSDVDDAGHREGPESRAVADAVARLDALLGRLVSGIRQLDLLPRTTIVVVSDHGMSQLDENRVIFLDDYLDPAQVSIVEWSPLLGVNARSGEDRKVYAALKDKHPSMHVFLRDETPPAFHYRSHHRIPAILAQADDGWTITSHARFAQDRARGRRMGGAHGFDPSLPSMRALLVAAGPRLRSGVRVPALGSVHLYDLFCEILGVTPAPNDGDPAVTRAWLQEP